MNANLSSSTVVGIDGRNVKVEVDISNGLPVFEIVGLPDSDVRESRDRVRAGSKTAGLSSLCNGSRRTWRPPI